MAIWGPQPLDNDVAVDLTFAIVRASDLSIVDRLLADVEAVGRDAVDEPLGSQAIAACEIVARLNGSPGEQSEFADVVDTWLERQRAKPDTLLATRARVAVARIDRGPSALRDEWKKGEEALWHAALADLDSRLARVIS